MHLLQLFLLAVFAGIALGDILLLRSHDGQCPLPLLFSYNDARIE